LPIDKFAQIALTGCLTRPKSAKNFKQQTLAAAGISKSTPSSGSSVTSKSKTILDTLAWNGFDSRLDEQLLDLGRRISIRAPVFDKGYP
jgi:hypothetical protein